MDFETILKNKKPNEKVSTACFSPDFIIKFNVFTWKDDDGEIWHQCDAYCLGSEIYKPTKDHWESYLQLKRFASRYGNYDHTGYTRI